jgi:hypothetical protein
MLQTTLAGKIFCVITLFVVVFMPMTTFAAKGTDADNYVPLAPSFVSVPDAKSGVNFETYVIGIFRTAIILAVVLAVLMIVWGGFEYLSTDSIMGKSDAKKKWENAGFGLALVLAAYLILNTINPNLVAGPAGGIKKVETRGGRGQEMALEETRRAIDANQKRAQETDISTGRAIYSVHTIRNSEIGSVGCSVPPEGYSGGNNIGGPGTLCGGERIPSQNQSSGFYTFCCKYDRLPQ